MNKTIICILLGGLLVSPLLMAWPNYKDAEVNLLLCREGEKEITLREGISPPFSFGRRRNDKVEVEAMYGRLFEISDVLRSPLVSHAEKEIVDIERGEVAPFSGVLFSTLAAKEIAERLSNEKRLTSENKWLLEKEGDHGILLDSYRLSIDDQRVYIEKIEKLYQGTREKLEKAQHRRWYQQTWFKVSCGMFAAYLSVYLANQIK